VPKIMSGLPEFPRPCEVTSHQFHLDGFCYALINGIALVESKSGEVGRFDLTGYYSIKFKDRD